jgi:PAS domain-containing protein
MIDGTLTTSKILDIFTAGVRKRQGRVTDTFHHRGRLFVRSLLPHVADVRPKDSMQGGLALRATDDELWLDVLHPDDAERMVAADARARETLSSLFAEYRMIARDGQVVWVSEKAAVYEDEATGTVYWQGVMVDITDRKSTDEALAASERQFRSIFDAAATIFSRLSDS